MVTLRLAYKWNLSAMVKAMPIFSLCLTITRFIKILELVLKWCQMFQHLSLRLEVWRVVGEILNFKTVQSLARIWFHIVFLYFLYPWIAIIKYCFYYLIFSVHIWSKWNKWNMLQNAVKEMFQWNENWWKYQSLTHCCQSITLPPAVDKSILYYCKVLHSFRTDEVEIVLDNKTFYFMTPAAPNIADWKQICPIINHPPVDRNCGALACIKPREIGFRHSDWQRPGEKPGILWSLKLSGGLVSADWRAHWEADTRHL